MRWRLYIEEYSPDLQYIRGKNNVVADTLSRLKMNPDPNPMEVLITEEMHSQLVLLCKRGNDICQSSPFILAARTSPTSR